MHVWIRLALYHRETEREEVKVWVMSSSSYTATPERYHMEFSIVRFFFSNTEHALKIILTTRTGAGKWFNTPEAFWPSKLFCGSPPRVFRMAVGTFSSFFLSSSKLELFRTMGCVCGLISSTLLFYYICITDVLNCAINIIPGLPSSLVPSGNN